jgi:hypothetical protein
LAERLFGIFAAETNIAGHRWHRLDFAGLERVVICHSRGNVLAKWKGKKIAVWQNIGRVLSILYKYSIFSNNFKEDKKMNKKFKKVISSLLAAVMTVGVVGVANVSSVFAEDETETQYNEIINYNMPASTDGITLPTGSGKLAVLKDDTDNSGIKLSWQRGASDSFGITPVTVGGVTYSTAIVTGSIAKSQLVIDGVQEGDRISVVFGAQGSSTNAYTISDAYDSSKYSPSTTPSVADNATTKSMSSKDAATVVHIAKKTCTYYAGYTTSKGGTYAVKVERPITNGYKFVASNADDYNGTFTFVPATIDSLDGSNVTVSYTGTDYDLATTTVTADSSNFVTDDDAKTASLDVSKLSLSKKLYTATVTQGSYTGTFTLSNESDITADEVVTLSYTGDDYTMITKSFSVNSPITGVAVADSVITVTPQSSWFRSVLPVVEVTPTVSGDVSTYNFKTSTDSYLVSQDDASAKSAYSKDLEGCYVKLTSDGAKLYDDSKSSSSTLVIPFTATSGTVTIAGEVTPKHFGGKWNIVDFGSVAIMSDNDKKIAFDNRSNSGSSHSSNAGATAENQKITYSVVFDLDNKTATATITNGNTTKELTASCSEIKNITFITNGGGSVTGEDDRELTIPSVTITAEAVEPEIVKADVNKVAYVKDGDDEYAVAIIGADKVGNVSFNLTDGTTVKSSDLDVVYSKVQLGSTEYTSKELTTDSTVGAYLYGFNLTGENAKSIIAGAAVNYNAAE